MKEKTQANKLNGYKVAVLAVDGFDPFVLPGGVVKICAEAIDQNGGKGVVLHSGRVDGMEPDRGTTA